MSYNKDEKIAIEIYKHYGNIRFVMLPMFFSTMGAVVVAYWKLLSVAVPDMLFQIYVSIIGLIVSLLFFTYEIKLSNLLVSVSSLMPDTMNGIKPSNPIGFITIITLLLYIVPAIFWSTFLYHHTLAFTSNDYPEFQISSECIESINIIKVAEASSWSVVAILSDSTADKLKVFSLQHLGENIKLVDGEGNETNASVLIGTVSSPIVIGTNKSKDEAIKLKLNVMSLKGECKKLGKVGGIL